MSDDVQVRIEQAREYLEAHGLRVIRVYWPERWDGEKYVAASPNPIMEVVPADDPRALGAIVVKVE